jgi:hypothetical protein
VKGYLQKNYTKKGQKKCAKKNKVQIFCNALKYKGFLKKKTLDITLVTWIFVAHDDACFSTKQQF